MTNKRKEIKDGYIKVPEYTDIIDKSVDKLHEYRDRGIKAYIDFNGKILYSDEVTLDSAYLLITGKTKLEYSEKERQDKERRLKEEEDYKARIPDLTVYWREKGREVLTKDKLEYWDKIVPIRLGDLYRGMELRQTLEIIEILNKDISQEDKFREANTILENQGHSGMSFGLICNMIKEFSALGEDFVLYVKTSKLKGE